MIVVIRRVEKWKRCFDRWVEECFSTHGCEVKVGERGRKTVLKEGLKW